MMLRKLFQLVWDSEYILECWREGLIVSLFKKMVIEKILVSNGHWNTHIRDLVIPCKCKVNI